MNAVAGKHALLSRISSNYLEIPIFNAIFTKSLYLGDVVVSVTRST